MPRANYTLPVDFPSAPTHFDHQNTFPAAVGVANTPTAAAFSLFGQIAISRSMAIRDIDVHQMVDGTAGNAVFEVYRRRAGVFTRLVSITLAQLGGNYAVNSGVPSDVQLIAGDYLYCQGVTAPTGGSGWTIDVHFNS